MESTEQILLLPLWYAVFLLSLTCHESAHAFAARRGGDDTAYLGGQVSLNPIPHVRRELFGTVLVPLLSYLYVGWMMGWASAPYDPLWEDRHPRRAALMAAAGPLANLLLAVVGFAVLRAGMEAGFWQPTPGDTLPPIHRLVAPTVENGGALEPLGRLFSIMLFLNLVLFLFNLIPLPPLDGASVLSGLFAPLRRLMDQLRASPMGGLIGIVLAWLVFPYVFFPVWFWVLRLLDF